jgi:hypothetical protein
LLPTDNFGPRGNKQQVQGQLPFMDQIDEYALKYGVDLDTVNQIKNDYNLRADMAQTEEEKATALSTARTEFQNAALGGGQSSGMGNARDALAMQAMIGNYIKPYADRYRGLQNEVANAYDQAARSMSGDFASVAKLGGAEYRANAEQTAGALMGSAMIDPIMATQQAQAAKQKQIEQAMFAQSLASNTGLGASSSSLGG